MVTSFLFQAHPVSTVLGGLIVHARERARDVLRHYRDFLASAPEDLTAYAALITTPDGQPAVAVIACYCGDLAEGERVLAPLRQFGPPRLPLEAVALCEEEASRFPSANFWGSRAITGRIRPDVPERVIAYSGESIATAMRTTRVLPSRRWLNRSWDR